MSNITDEQLWNLTSSINQRLDEFNMPGVPMFDSLSAGVVRLMANVIIEWLDGTEADERRRGDEWVEGFQRGLKVGTDVNHIEYAPIVSHGNGAQGGVPDVDDPDPIDSADLAGNEHWVAGHTSEELAEISEANIKSGREQPLPPPPDPDIARERLAVALANGSGGELVAAINKPRTLADVDEDADERPKEWNGKIVPTREQVIAELQRIAMAGTMPTMEQFNENRPANWATASAHTLRLGMSWEELAEEAGLKPRRTHRA